MKEQFSVFRLCGRRFFLATVLLFFMGIGKTAFSQVFNYDIGACTNGITDIEPTEPKIPVTSAMNITINAVNVPGGGTATMSILRIDITSGGFPVAGGCDPCGSPIPPIHGMTFSAAGSQVTVIGSPTVVGNEYSVTVRAVGGGKDCSRIYRFKVVAPVDLMLVLDGSGSMEWGLAGPPVAVSPNRRWDFLKTGVTAMANQLASLNTSGTIISQDRVNLRIFSTHVLAQGPPFNAGLVSLSSNIANLGPAVPANQPGGWTGLGEGILTGRDLIKNDLPTNTKAMIVFSDGEQTIGHGENAGVKDAGAGAFTETTDGQSLSNGGQIKIYTINLGASGSAPLMMSSIATNNGGTFYNTTAATTQGEIESFFSMQVFNIFSNRSPQFVDVRKGSFSFSATGQSPASEQSFSVSKGANSVIVTMLVPSTQEARFTSFMKDGTELIQFAQQTSGPGFISIALNYPVNRLPGTMLNGDWKVRAQLGTAPRTALPYTMMIVTDDHLLRPEYSLGAASFKEGDVLRPTARLFALGRPIANAAIQGIAVQPGDNIDDLIARANVAATSPTVDSTAPNVTKLAVLMQDSTFVNRIKVQNRLFNLVYDAADSTYKGTFNGLNVSGVYQMIYRITATDSVLGKIQRFHQNSFYVRFPNIVADNSNMTVSQTGNLTTLTFRPITGNGKFIGPGWGNTIVLNAPNAKVSRVVDRGDGTYSLILSGSLSGNGTLSLGGADVYSGPLEDIGKPSSASGMAFSLHAGATFPSGDFTNTHSSGWFGEIDLERRFSNYFSVELVGGLYNFDPDYKITGVTLYPKLNIPFAPFNLYLGAGPGYYKPDGMDASSGWSGRAGLQYRLNNKLRLEVNGAGFWLNVPGTNNRNFSTLGLGIKRSF